MVLFSATVACHVFKVLDICITVLCINDFHSIYYLSNHFFSMLILFVMKIRKMSMNWNVIDFIFQCICVCIEQCIHHQHKLKMFHSYTLNPVLVFKYGETHTHTHIHLFIINTLGFLKINISFFCVNSLSKCEFFLSLCVMLLY